MGLAERAELVARLSFKDDFSGPLGRATGKVNTSFDGVTKQAGIAGHAISTALGVVAAQAIQSGIGALAGAFRGGEASLQELEAVGLRTNAVIESTGGVAGITAEQVRKLAEQYENLSTNDDKAIQNTENLLLTFTSIRKDAFEPTLQAVLDMNAALGGGDEGLQGTAILVGKALQDPIKGITALRRVGVNFSDDQLTVIKRLVETGDTLGAQKVILKELNTEFGGQAGAFGTGRAADVRRLQDAVEDFQRAFATGLAPAVDAARTGLTTLLRDPAIVEGIQSLGEGLAEFLTPANINEGIGLLKGAFTTVADLLPTIKDAAVITGGVLKEAVGLFTSLPPDLQKLAIGALAVNKLTGGAASNVIGSLLQIGLKGLQTIVAGNVTVVGTTVTGPGGPTAPGGGILGNVRDIFAFVSGLAIAEAVGQVIHQFRESVFPDPVGPALGPNGTIAQNLAKIDATLTAPEFGGLSPDDRQVIRDQKRAIENLGVAEANAMREESGYNQRIIDRLEANRLAILSTPPPVVNLATKITILGQTVTTTYSRYSNILPGGITIV